MMKTMKKLFGLLLSLIALGIAAGAHATWR